MLAEFLSMTDSYKIIICYNFMLKELTICVNLNLYLDTGPTAEGSNKFFHEEIACTFIGLNIFTYTSIMIEVPAFTLRLFKAGAHTYEVSAYTF